jgi:nucleoside kinase
MKSLDLFAIGSWTIFDHIFKMSQYPSQGDTVTLDMPIEQLNQIAFGDCSANVAATAARLGLRVGLGMVVGEDFVTSGYQARLQKLGVDLSGVQIVPGEQSGHSYLYFDANGDGFCISHLGLAADQSAWEIPTAAITASRVVVVNEKFSPYTLKAIQLAKTAGAITVINGMIATAGSDTRAFLENADILFIAESELHQLLALLELNQVRELHGLGPERIFVTRGTSGSRIFEKETYRDVDIVTASKIVDTTGAGDAYVGGTMTAILRGLSDVEAARIGATVSSFVVEAWGCQTNLPDWNDVIHRKERISRSNEA